MRELGPSDEEGLGELFGRLVEDGKGYARAEVRYYQTLLRAKLGEATSLLWMGATALVLAHSALIAVIVGLLLTLSPRVGPGWATVIVVLGFLVAAGLMGWLAYGHARRIFGKKP